MLNITIPLSARVGCVGDDLSQNCLMKYATWAGGTYAKLEQ